MTDDLSVALEDFLRKKGIQTDFIREALHTFVHLLMEVEVTKKIGARRYERTKERTNSRNGYCRGSPVVETFPSHENRF
ncbi:MAG: transposase [Firmicutes bacterium]|nr:transposase [Bacillota bacterium]